jgi:hypothetical protein
MGLSEMDEQIARYLLGEMSENEHSAFDERLVLDASFFEEVCAQEDELIMRYLRGKLEKGVAARFQKVYLNQPARRGRIESARFFRKAVHAAGRQRRWGWIGQVFGHNGLRAAVAVAAMAAIVLAVVWQRPVNKQSPALGKDSAQIAQNTPPKLSFRLEPGLLRSGSGLQISLPAETGEVQLKLIWRKGAALQGYRAVLGTPERPNVWSGEAVFQDGVLIATVPAHVLIPGDYLLELQTPGQGSKAERQVTYYFRVAK